jgi:hypothetical protein
MVSLLTPAASKVTIVSRLLLMDLFDVILAVEVGTYALGATAPVRRELIEFTPVDKDVSEAA